MGTTKRCIDCSETKSVDDFYLRDKTKNYRTSMCKQCNHKRLRDRRKNNPAWAIWRNVTTEDRRRCWENDLTRDDVVSMVADGCSYCGETNIKMTLDRIDNSRGHLRDNVVASCIRCNLTKSNMPYAAWVLIASAMREARDKGLFGGWTGPTGGFINK